MKRFAMKGNKAKCVYGSHSLQPLEIRGCFTVRGPQPVGIEGGTPQWVSDLFDTQPDIDIVCISGKNGGVVWNRIGGE